MNLPFSVYPSGWIDKRLSSSLCTLEHMNDRLSRLLSMMYRPLWRSSVHLAIATPFSGLLLRHGRRRFPAQRVLGRLQPRLRGPFELHAVRRVPQRRRDRHQHRGVVRSDHGPLHSSQTRQLGHRLFERLRLHRQTPLCHRRRPCRRGQVLRLRQLCLPLRHRRLRHFGRPRRFGGRCGVRFRRSLRISLKGSKRDVPPPSSIYYLFIYFSRSRGAGVRITSPGSRGRTRAAPP